MKHTEARLKFPRRLDLIDLFRFL